MLIILWPFLPITVPIAIGSILLAALGLFTPAGNPSQIIAVGLAVLF
ncbi:MAG TPA: hypothetical protein VEG44_10365 [Candidatus Acidoferrales bacterium]|nr:hypothetical protein [Candidatus Acidoferrales bacterium]